MKDKNLPRQVYSDEIKLKQILINLLSNSIKFTRKGKITLTVNLTQNNSDIEFSVEDTGQGIDERHTKSLF
jgi:signal transduction histidine kinase